MHELGLTQNILKIALHHAQTAEAVRVKELHLVIGELSRVVDESLQFYWDIIAQDTIAAGARLNFKHVPAKLHCNACGHESPMNSRDFSCAACQSENVIIAGGDEFFLESIDIDLESEQQPEI